MKTTTAGISAGTLITLLTAFAMVPLPTIQGSPTGLKFIYQIFASPHIMDVGEWVAGLDSLAYDKDNNGEAINTVQFEAYIHAGGKPKLYEFEDKQDYRDAMEDWREAQKILKEKLRKLQEKRGDLIEQREAMLAQTPIRSFWKRE